jgi:hypothetical protein
VYRASVTKDGDNLLAASEKVGIAP